MRCRRDGASAGGCAATAFTGSRTRGSRAARRELLGSATARAANRQLPPRRRRVAVRDRRRRLARHDDGLHAARGARDGDPLGQRRPGAAAVAAGARAAVSAASWPTRWSTIGSARARRQRRHARDPRRAPRRASRRRALALDVYLHRLRAAIAAMAAALGGLDVLVFTGGVGERAAAVRAGAAGGLGFLGVEIDARRNDALGARRRDRRAAAPRAHARDRRPRGPGDRAAGQGGVAEELDLELRKTTALDCGK